MSNPTTIPAGPVFQEGDRVLCADGMTRTVRAMAPLINGEPVRVVVEDGTEWIAANCRRANPADLAAARMASSATAARVRQADTGDPQWHAALADLTAAHAFLKAAETSAAVLEGLARGHAEAARMLEELEAGAPVLAGDDEEEAERRAMVDAQLTPADEEHALREEIAALFTVLAADGQAHDFQPVHVRGDARPIAWTYRTGYGSAARYGWVLAGGRARSEVVSAMTRVQAERSAAHPARRAANAAVPLALAFASMSLDALREALVRLQDRAARTRGTTPQHVLNDDVRAALEALAACHFAEVTREFNPGAAYGAEDHDWSVTGVVVEPRENGHVAAYWVESGRYVTAAGDPFAEQLQEIRRKFQDAGWKVVPGSRRVVTAYRRTA